MSHENYDPAKQPCSPEFHSDPECCSICGPGGNHTLINNNEKGILENWVFKTPHRQAELRAHNDPFKQGIYTTNSVGDND